LRNNSSGSSILEGMGDEVVTIALGLDSEEEFSWLCLAGIYVEFAEDQR
jgi:hypothetical protein